jgi:type IV pilus assembly protein PilY1
MPRNFAKKITACLAAACMVAQPAFAGVTDIASVPLGSTAGSTFLPNLLFTLDDSGSMAWHFLPDYVDPNTSGMTNNPCMTDNTGSTNCNAGDPPFSAGGQFAMNGVGYDPNFTYLVGLTSAGAPVLNAPSGTLTPTSVTNDAYLGGGTTNLTTSIQDQRYCNSKPSGAPNSWTALCKRNGQDDSSGNLVSGLDDQGNTLTAGQFPYHTNASNASTGVIFGLPEMMQLGSFTRSGSTVTVGTISAPGVAQNDPVYINTGNANLDASCVTVTGVTGPNLPPNSPYTFTYTMSSSKTVSATTGSYRKCVTGSFTYSKTTGLVTVTTTANHGLVTNDGITTVVSGATVMSQASANVTVTSSTSFTYPVSNNANIAATAGLWVRSDLYNTVNNVNGPAVSYWIKPIEWCKDVALTDCAQYIPPAAVPADHPFPAYVRFCRSQVEALAPGAVTFVNSSPTVARCQLKYVNTTVSGNPVQYIWPRFGWFNRDTIRSTTLSYTNRANRSDCAAAPTCTYTEEIQNYSKWFAYYQTRMQMMKTSAGRAFLPFISAPTATPPKPDRLRVGFITINPAIPNGSNNAQTNVQSSKYLRIDTFNTTNAANWYTKFYAIIPSPSTPLRLALSRAGWIYAGKLNTGLTAGIPTSDDPMQASCQKNFTFLTTDGFWNQGTGQDLAGNAIGNTGNKVNSAAVNQDGLDNDSAYNAGLGNPNPYAGTNPPDFFSSRASGTYDGTAAGSTPATAGTTAGTAGTLADVSMYYYRTDLRGGFDLNNNATGPSTSPNTTPTGGDVATNNVPAVTGSPDFAVHQHMNTFTIGLADGLLRYQSNYDNVPTPPGDFANIKGAAVGQCFWSGAGNPCNWPSPVQNGQEALDDLWHAAVNGRGKFFSALNPTALANGLNGALNALQVTTASASAAATSSPQVSASNTMAFSTTYETSLWAGQVYAQLIDPSTGNVITTGANNGKVWEADTLMLSKIAPSSDTRNIVTFDLANNNGSRLKQFQWGNLTAAEQAYFLNKCLPLSNMAQCNLLTPAQLITANDGTDLVSFLRGQTGNEGTVFRDRSEQDPNTLATIQTVMGDIINAQPVDILPPFFKYENESTHPEPTGQSYPTFRTNNATRVGPLLIASNDGYLHAFNPNTGVENWAYLPRFLMPGVYQLADVGYPGQHRYFVDGTPETTDVFDATAAIWKTIVVGGLNSGGRGFYALDVTDPLNPKGLWEFCSDSTLCPTDASGNIHSDSDLGFSYGNPIIGRRVSDGRWVVVVTSGLNNVSSGTGVGFWYVLDAITGQILHKVSTGVGSTTTPSGLMKSGGYYPDGIDDPTFTHVYSGDQLGNVWRLDMSQTMSPFPAVTSGSPTVKLLATLKDGAGRIQPITARPAATHIGTTRVYYVGTGRYLGNSDLADPGAASGIAWQQSIYGIRDQLDNVGFTPQASFRNGNVVVQTLAATSANRTISKNPVNWATQDGFYVDLNPGNTTPGERVFLDVRLILGTLIVTSNIPSAGGACVPGGNSFQYGLDYQTGGYVGNVSNITVGLNVGAFLVGAAVEQTADNQIKALNKTITGQNITTPVPLNAGYTAQRFDYRER